MPMPYAIGDPHQPHAYGDPHGVPMSWLSDQSVSIPHLTGKPMAGLMYGLPPASTLTGKGLTTVAIPIPLFCASK